MLELRFDKRLVDCRQVLEIPLRIRSKNCRPDVLANIVITVMRARAPYDDRLVVEINGDGIAAAPLHVRFDTIR